VNEDNPCNAKWEASRRSRNKERQYLKDKINELISDSKNKNIRDQYRGINEFKKGYQPRTNLVKDERGNLLADPHKILNKWKNYLSAVECAGRLKYIQLSHLCQSTVPLRLRLLLES
jgi:hypothetical protein